MTKTEFAQKLYNAYRRLFNDKFDPMIRGHEVEIYVEPLEGAETSEGLEEGVMKVKKYIAEAGSSRYNPQYTAREVARDVKAKVDDLVRELVDKYGMKVIKSATVMNVFEREPAMALMDLEAEGKVLTNAERWQ